MVATGNRNGVGCGVGRNAKPNVVSFAVPFEIGDLVFVCVVFPVFPQILVNLVVGCCGVEAVKGFKRFRTATFGDSIVHDGYCGGQCLKQCRVVASVKSMVSHLVDVNFGANDVCRANQGGFDVPGEVSGVKESEISQFEEHDHAVGVVRVVVGFLIGQVFAVRLRGLSVGKISNVSFGSQTG